MSILEVRAIIAAALQECEALDQVLPLGNAVHAYADGQEFKVVIRTVQRERDCGADGPVAQE